MDREIAELRAKLTERRRLELKALRETLHQLESSRRSRDDSSLREEGREELNSDDSCKKGHRARRMKRMRRNQAERKAKK